MAVVGQLRMSAFCGAAALFLQCVSDLIIPSMSANPTRLVSWASALFGDPHCCAQLKSLLICCVHVIEGLWAHVQLHILKQRNYGTRARGGVLHFVAPSAFSSSLQ